MTYLGMARRRGGDLRSGDEPGVANRRAKSSDDSLQQRSPGGLESR